MFDNFHCFFDKLRKNYFMLIYFQQKLNFFVDNIQNVLVNIFIIFFNFLFQDFITLYYIYLLSFSTSFS